MAVSIDAQAAINQIAAELEERAIGEEIGRAPAGDAWYGEDETYGTLDQFLTGEETTVRDLYPDIFNMPSQYYDAERGGFINVHGSMSPQYTNKFAEIIDQTPIGKIADFAYFPEGWRGKVDPSTNLSKRTTVEEAVSMLQTALTPPALVAKGLIGATNYPALVAMAPVLWQGAARTFTGKPSLDFVGSAKRGLAFGWGQYFSDRRSIAGGYTQAPEFKVRSTVYDIDKLETPTSPQQGHYKMVDMSTLQTELVENYRAVGKLITDHNMQSIKSGFQEGAAKLKDDEKYKKLRAIFKEIEYQMNSVMFMRMNGDKWETAIRDSFQHGKPDIHGATVDGYMSKSEVDRMIKVGREIWDTVKQTAGGKTMQWDVSDALIGKKGDKLLDWHVQFKNHPKATRDKVISALKELSRNPNYSKVTIHQRIDTIMNKLHGRNALGSRAVGFKVDGRKYRPAPLTEEMIRLDFLDEMTGEEIYNKILNDIPVSKSKGSWAGILEAQKATSLHLGEFGVPGLRYTAGTLSGRPANRKWNADITRNYVLWDQDILNLMTKLAEY